MPYPTARIITTGRFRPASALESFRIAKREVPIIDTTVEDWFEWNLTGESHMTKLKFAFMGFRHGHINGLYDLLRKRDDAEIVAACEEHEPTRRTVQSGGQIAITHEKFESMLDRVSCDVVATGEYYGRRGSVLIEALRRGKHVISDKPICTSLSEWQTVHDLAQKNGLVVGCQLEMRDGEAFSTMRELIQRGEIGKVHAISFNGQHPLMYGTRAGWYFEEGKHGGTINDVAIHAIDGIPWVTGLKFQTVNAARNWNARLKQVPHFADAAQMMLTMDNGAGVLGDVSYFAPDSFGYSLPHYWRTTFWGEEGVLESNNQTPPVMLYKNGEKTGRAVSVRAAIPGGYLECFIREIRGDKKGLHLTSAEVLESSRVALVIQQAADQQRTQMPVR
jgi:predicted dehydrogenase